VCVWGCVCVCVCVCVCHVLVCVLGWLAGYVVLGACVWLCGCRGCVLGVGLGWRARERVALIIVVVGVPLCARVCVCPCVRSVPYSVYRCLCVRARADTNDKRKGQQQENQ